MNYDFAQIVKVDGSEVMVYFTIKAEYKEGKKNKKTLAGTDSSGANYTAIGVNDCNYKTNAENVMRVGGLPSILNSGSGYILINSIDKLLL